MLARSARSERGNRGPAPGVSTGCLIRGFAQVDALQRELRRLASHTLKQPAFAPARLHPHEHAGGWVRRSTPGVSAAAEAAKTSASTHTSQHLWRGVPLVARALRPMSGSWTCSGKKPLARPAKNFCYRSARTTPRLGSVIGHLPVSGFGAFQIGTWS